MFASARAQGLAAGAIVALTVVLTLPGSPFTADEMFAAVMITVAVLVATAAAVVDVRERLIPDRFVVAAAAPIVAVFVRELATGHGGPAAGAIAAGAALLAGPIFAIHLVQPAAMGFGDVKLGVVLGGAVGLADWRWSLVALCIASGLTAAVGLITRARELPFAPGLVAATALVLPTATGGVLLPWH